MTTAERFREFAANARQRSGEATAARHTIERLIPPGQPILVGHHSERKHRQDLERTDRLMRTSIEQSERADYWDRRANAVEHRKAVVEEAQRLSTEGVDIGDRVVARFTNSGNIHEFTGKIVGRTKNDWKVLPDAQPYADDDPGRVFKIAASGSRIHSANNCVRSLS